MRGGEASPPLTLLYFWESQFECSDCYKILHGPQDIPYGGIGEIQSRFQLRTMDNDGSEVVKGALWRNFWNLNCRKFRMCQNYDSRECKPNPEPPQRFQSGVHNLCEDCDAVGHARSRKSTILRQFYDNFTTILRQFYDNFAPGTATRPVLFRSLPKSLRMKYGIGTARFGTIFRHPTSGGILSDQNCCKIVVKLS